MLIEISGAGFRNKGAELMLGTVVEELRRRIADARFCMRPESPYPRMCEYGVMPILTLGSRHPERRLAYWRGQWLGRLVSRRLLRRHNLVRSDEPQALIDISGYAFGDKIEFFYLQRLQRKTAEYAHRQKPVILLPQMFGPFEKSLHRKAFRSAMRHVDVAYARDHFSHAHAVAAVEDPARIKLAPDITIFADPLPQDFVLVPPRPFACLVPNVRMVTAGASDWGDRYLDLLIRAGREMLLRGLDVLVVVHETSGADEDLAKNLVRQLSNGDRVRLLPGARPLQLKALFWKSRLLVSSRFHSIVSALSGGVPTILLGWAHKYEALASDFGVPQCVFRATDPAERMTELTATLLDAEAAQTRNVLEVKKQELHQLNEAMWGDVVGQLAELCGTTSTANVLKRNARPS
jgi:polysaccharide pyruvyl transferase WcaK-like protein